MKILWDGLFNNHSSLGIISNNIVPSLITLGHTAYIAPWPESNLSEVSYSYTPYADQSVDVVIRLCDPYSATAGLERVLRKKAKIHIPYIYFDKGVLEQEYVNKLNMIPYILTTSQFTKSILIKNGVKSKVYVVPHGINKSEFINVPINNKNLGRLTLIYAGYLGGFRKGLDLLLETIHSYFLDDKRIQFIIKTNDDARLNIKSNNIRIIGGIQDRQSFYEILSQAHYFIAPARMESFGMVGLEALAVGTSIISPLNSAYSEYGLKAPYSQLLIDGQWKTRNNPDDTTRQEYYWEIAPGELATLINYIIETRSYLYNSNEVQTYAFNYTWDLIANKLSDTLTEIITSI